MERFGRNAADHLADIFEDCRKQWNASGSVSGPQALRTVFLARNVHEGDPAAPDLRRELGEDDQAFYTFVNSLTQLPDQILVDLRAAEARELSWAEDTLMKARGAILGIMSAANSAQGLAVVTEAIVLGLRGASAALDGSGLKQRPIESDTLTNIVTEARRLRDLVMTDDEMPTSLRRFLRT